MCPLSGPAPCSSPPDVHPFPHHWVSAKPIENAFCIGHPGAPEAGGWVLGVEAPLRSPAPGTAPPGKQCPPRRGEARRGRTSRLGHFPPGLAPGRGHPLLTPRGERKILPPGPPSEVAPQVAGGRRAVPSRFQRAPAPALALSPRPLGRIPGRRRAEAGPGAGGGGLTSHCPRRRRRWRRRRSGTPAGCGGSCGCGPAWAGSWCA